MFVLLYMRDFYMIYDCFSFKAKSGASSKKQIDMLVERLEERNIACGPGYDIFDTWSVF